MELINDNFSDFPVDFPENGQDKNQEPEIREDNLYPDEFPESKSIIKVIGVGGGGCNVVTEIYKTGVSNIDLMICNTDEQALGNNPVNEKIKLGVKGLGAGCDPRKGREAALSSQKELEKSLGDKIEMVFVAACLGGGTGTGASPIIAEIAKKKGKLVVGVVTLPFRYEGADFMSRAMEGLKELRKHVDSLLIIDNQKIYDVYGGLSMMQAYQKVNEVLVTSVKTISEIVTNQGYINVDMNDVRWIMGESGMVTMGIGVAEGEDRAEKAVEEAFKSPLLSDCDLKTSKGVLVNIICNPENYKMDEEKTALENVKSFTGDPEKLKRGIVWDHSMGNKVCVTILATGFDVLNLPDADGRNTIIIPGRVAADGTTSVSYSKPKEEKRNFPEVEKGPVIEEMKPKRRTGGDKPVLITEDESEILELENTPAYERRNKKRSTGINIGNTANFSISGGSDSQAIIPSNRYLHQTQD